MYPVHLLYLQEQSQFARIEESQVIENKKGRRRRLCELYGCEIQVCVLLHR